MWRLVEDAIGSDGAAVLAVVSVVLGIVVRLKWMGR